MKKTAQQLVDEANRRVETLPVAQAFAMLERPGHLFVDLRDIRELWRSGTIPGAIHAPRGMLEF
jgi:rhodanese-related sulfurtransferase